MALAARFAPQDALRVVLRPGARRPTPRGTQLHLWARHPPSGHGFARVDTGTRLVVAVGWCARVFACSEAQSFAGRIYPTRAVLDAGEHDVSAFVEGDPSELEGPLLAVTLEAAVALPAPLDVCWETDEVAAEPAAWAPPPSAHMFFANGPHAHAAPPTTPPPPLATENESEDDGGPDTLERAESGSAESDDNDRALQGGGEERDGSAFNDGEGEEQGDAKDAKYASVNVVEDDESAGGESRPALAFNVGEANAVFDRSDEAERGALTANALVNYNDVFFDESPPPPLSDEESSVLSTDSEFAASSVLSESDCDGDGNGGSSDGGGGDQSPRSLQ